MELVFNFFVLPLMAFCMIAAIFLAAGINVFEKTGQLYKRLTNTNCRAGRHEYRVNEYIFYEYDEAHMQCRHCGHCTQGRNRQGEESASQYLQEANQHSLS